ncbi:MAG: hypothetical protein QM602_07925 [Microbacterium sp.]
MSAAEPSVRRRRRGPDAPLPAERVRARLSAFVYGNVLVLAAILALTPHDLEDGTGMLVVLVTAGTTLCAHLLAHAVGSLAGRRLDEPWRHVRAGLRDAVPIATSAILPTVCLIGAVLHVYSADTAQAIACGLVLVRLALMGLITRRLFPLRSRRAALWAGVGIAGAGLAIAVVKLLVTH